MATTPPSLPPPNTPVVAISYAAGISATALVTNLVFLALSASMIFTGVFLGQHKSISTLVTINVFSLGITLLLLQAIHLGLSLQIVLENRSAMLLRFGAYAGNVKPGLVYVMWPLYQLISVTKNMIEFDIPDSPEKIFHGDLTEDTSDGVVPKGYTPALRITFAPPQPLEKDKDGYEVTIKDPIKGGQETKSLIIPKDDAYYKRNTTEIEASVGFCVTNLRTFYEKIGSVDNASRSMNDHAVSGLNSRLPKFTLAEALLRLDEFAFGMIEDLTQYSNDWGICVVFFRFKHPGVSHTLNAAVSGVAVAGENLKTTRLAAEGIKTTLTQTGLGKANAEFDLLSARGHALKEMADVAATPGGALAMTVNATQEALVAAKTVIVPTDNIMGMIAGASGMLKNIPDIPTANQDQTPPKKEQEYGADVKKYGGKKGKDKK